MDCAYNRLEPGNRVKKSGRDPDREQLGQNVVADLMGDPVLLILTGTLQPQHLASTPIVPLRYSERKEK